MHLNIHDSCPCNATSQVPAQEHHNTADIQKDNHLTCHSVLDRSLAWILDVILGWILCGLMCMILETILGTILC